MNYIIAVLVVGFLALVVFVIKQKRKNAMELIELERKIAAQIKTQGKTFQEWNDQRKLDIKALHETTIKAHEDARGELIITTPDGKTKINEFKINKEA